MKKRNTSTGHRIEEAGRDRFRIVWQAIGFNGPGNLALHSRTVDREGAQRFAKRWGCPMPGGES